MTKPQIVIKIFLAIFYCLVSATLTSVIYIAMSSALGESGGEEVFALMAFMFLLPVNAMVGYLVSRNVARHIDWPYLSVVLIPLVAFFVGLPVDALAQKLVYVVVALVCVFGAYRGRQEMLNNLKQADAQNARAAV